MKDSSFTDFSVACRKNNKKMAYFLFHFDSMVVLFNQLEVIVMP